ncbi:unnamed protein product [Heligmosomoides polygyrus]|uniref:Reverse transcriptase domain-containing protein n=1 Tax=Heligmosomoides polygyrus TaxID=6339 RepID=A0A183GAC8_HELPZ|nr:unnamed protein product [Heligmosomoides polygyrus]
MIQAYAPTENATDNEKDDFYYMNGYKIRLDKCESIDERWEAVKTALSESAEATIGRRRGKRKEQWIREETWKLIDERKRVKQRKECAKTPDESREAGEIFSELDRQVKASCRRDKKAWIAQKETEAQTAASRGDSRTLYRIVSELTGPRLNTCVPIKDKSGRLLVSEAEQNERWVKHLREVYNQPQPSATPTFNHENGLGELNINTGYITVEETKTAIRGLKNGKAPGLDEIAEMLEAGAAPVAEQLTTLFNSCWHQHEVPEYWKKGLVVKQPKKEAYRIAETGEVSPYCQCQAKFSAPYC